MTVIVPAYNSEATIETCLAAIRQSTYREYELIVVDDGSQDQTASLARQHADTVIELDENRGCSEARNRGIRASRGDIVVNIDSDVLVKADTLAVVQEFFAVHPHIDALTGLLAKEHPHHEFFSQYKNLYMHYIFSRLPEAVTFLYGSTHALRRESACLLYDEEIKRANDTALGQKLLRHGKAIALVKRLEVVHLKKHSWLSFVKNDFWIPFDWARIFVKYQGWKQLGRRGSGYAHSPREQLASLILAPTALLLLALTLAGRGLFAYAALGGALWFLLNIHFLAYLTRAKGIGFGAASIVVTFLDHIVMATGVVAGLIAVLWSTRRKLRARGGVNKGPNHPSAD